MRRTTHAIFTANHEDHVFGLAQTEARHEIVEGILSPEEWLLSRVPVVAAGRADVALPGATIAIIALCKKF
jgi:hypothetical protein